MIDSEVDVLIVGAGPVGLMCAYLGALCGIKSCIVDKADGPLQVGRADALNARTLQLLEIVKLFDDLYPLGKPCNTSSVWANGKFVSRESTWWDTIEGCFHRHFCMLGQSNIEKILIQRLHQMGVDVIRSTSVDSIELSESGCFTRLSDGKKIHSAFVIGADGSRSFVRSHFNIPFEIERPQLIWAVIDGVIESDFPKVPEIIVFQSDTSDVAWIPREGNIDRFYIRMDTKQFTLEDVLYKINKAIKPHYLNFSTIEWFSQFSVKESVAEKFSVKNRIFLAGDSCHVHSVNGGQGLNTGLGDAFNLLWKMKMVLQNGASQNLLQTFEEERKPVAQSVIESSGALVRSTKYSPSGTHAQDYVKIVQQRSGNITGMGIRYGSQGLCGTRIYDFDVFKNNHQTRLYSLLTYTKFTLLLFGDVEKPMDLPSFVQTIVIHLNPHDSEYWTNEPIYQNQAILVRPDSYIESITSLDKKESLCSFQIRS